MSDLTRLFDAQADVRRWSAERENADARLDIAQMRQRAAFLISQFEPVKSLGLDRARLRLVLGYIEHGDLDRLAREHTELRVAEAKVVATP